MSDKLAAGHVPFSTYQRSTAELIVALLWLLTFALAVSLDTATRGTMIAAIIPRIVTTAKSSISEKPLRLCVLRVIRVSSKSYYYWLLQASLVDPVGRRIERVGGTIRRIHRDAVWEIIGVGADVR